MKTLDPITFVLPSIESLSEQTNKTMHLMYNIFHYTKSTFSLKNGRKNSLSHKNIQGNEASVLERTLPPFPPSNLCKTKSVDSNEFDSVSSYICAMSYLIFPYGGYQWINGARKTFVELQRITNSAFFFALLFSLVFHIYSLTNSKHHLHWQRNQLINEWTTSSRKRC